MNRPSYLRSSNFESMPACLFGKTATQGDFVRIRTGSHAAAFVQDWIEDGHARRLDVGAAPFDDVVHFVLAIPGSDAIVVGALSPSRDSVGREFPVAIYAEVPSGKNIAPELVPIAAQRYLAQVGGLLAAAPTLTPRDLERALAALPPVLDAIDEAVPACEVATNEQGIRDFVARCFVGNDAFALEYAIDTVLRAAEMAKSEPNGSRGIVLGCPMAIDVDLFAWLALIAASSKGLRMSWTWTESSPALFTALTEPTGRLLSFVGRATANSSSLWPLSTPNVNARVDASNRLPESLRNTLAADVSLGDAVADISRNVR